MADLSLTEWDSFLAQHPDHHILQTSPWGQLKAEFGWKVTRIAVNHCGAQLLVRQVYPGIRFAYLPKGPVGADWEQLWPEINAYCRRQHCVFIKIEPDMWEPEDEQTGKHAADISENIIASTHSIQPMRTLLVDISDDEAQILGRMKQKTRYNINLALKKNVVVNPHTDMSTFYHLMEITGQRDQFGIHSLAYYQRAFDLFHARVPASFY
jgi:lipid II:glycine glycyltransferase (peptidoglycan interpeptide bridge formation enzyme)